VTIASDNDGEPDEHSEDGVLVIRTQIRFALNQLSSDNGSFPFEALCRQLARMTIARNILPATGPVQAGGDQGRDAETYLTDLPGQVQRLGGSLGIHDGDGVAFACTLQQDRVLEKFGEDIANVMASGTPVRFVVAYCEANVPVGQRHGFQAAMREAHDVHVEIFDGTAIAELLADRTLYWLAREHLHVPLATFPNEDENRPSWYGDDLARWHRQGASPTSMGDLTDLTGCVRYATRTSAARGDLEFWISKLEVLLGPGVPERIRSDAIYEIAVAHLRGFRNMRPVDALAVEFIEGHLDDSDPSNLEDAAVLTAYCFGAINGGVTSLTPDRVSDWQNRLNARIEYLLDRESRPGSRCSLLATLAHLRLQVDIPAFFPAEVLALSPQPRGPQDGSLDPDALVGIERLPRVEYPFRDLNGAFAAWSEILEISIHTRLFPIENVARLVRLFSNILGDDPRYDPLAVAFDDRVGQERGEATRGTFARNRAMAYYQRGRLLESLRDLHRALPLWFSGHANVGLFIGLRFTANVYDELSLSLAAKQHALIAARHLPPARESDMWRALASIARSDFHCGAWLSAVDTGALALGGYQVYEENPFGDEADESLSSLVYGLLMIRHAARELGGEYERYVSNALDRWNGNEILDDALEGAGEPWWGGMPIEAFLSRVEQELGHPAFSDGGETRTIAWKALGVTWYLRFPNDAETTLVAERFTAVAQVTAADLALRDPCMWPTHVTVEISTLPAEDVEVVEATGYEERGQRWSVALPSVKSSDPDAVQTALDQTVRALVPIFVSVSALGGQAIVDLFEGAFRDELVSKLCLGTIYDVSYREILSPDEAEFEIRRRLPPLGQGDPRGSDLLAAPSLPGPGFSEAEGVDAAARMYEIAPSLLRNTLPLLLADPGFLEIARRLRADGWLDRHILLAAVNLAHNRHNPVTGDETADEMKAVGRRFRDPEPDGRSVSPTEFTEEALRMHLQLTQLATAATFDLEFRPARADPQAVDELLTKRYEYWVIDARHPDLLAGPSWGATASPQ
jgi:hypothetical protein